MNDYEKDFLRKKKILRKFSQKVDRMKIPCPMRNFLKLMVDVHYDTIEVNELFHNLGILEKDED